MIEQTNLTAVKRIYDAFGRGDITAILGLMDPQSELIFEGPRSIPWAGTWNGVDGWTRFFAAVGANAEDVTLSMQTFMTHEDRVAAFGRYRARVKSTNKTIDSPLIHLWTLKNGKVTACLEYTNTAAEAMAFVASGA